MQILTGQGLCLGGAQLGGQGGDLEPLVGPSQEGELVAMDAVWSREGGREGGRAGGREGEVSGK